MQHDVAINRYIGIDQNLGWLCEDFSWDEDYPEAKRLRRSQTLMRQEMVALFEGMNTEYCWCSDNNIVTFLKSFLGNFAKNPQPIQHSEFSESELKWRIQATKTNNLENSPWTPMILFYFLLLKTRETFWPRFGKSLGSGVDEAWHSMGTWEQKNVTLWGDAGDPVRSWYQGKRSSVLGPYFTTDLKTW